MTLQVLVIGGTGRMGRHIAQKLVHRGEQVTILSRNAEKSKDEELANTTLVNGSILDKEKIEEHGANKDAIVMVIEPSFNPLNLKNSPKKLFIEGQQNVIEAAKQNSVPILLISQIYITRPHKMPLLSGAIKHRGEGEELLRSSGLPYTIIRAAWLEDTSDGQKSIRFEQGDTGDGKITREDVAEVCVQSIYHSDAHHKTFEIYNEEGLPINDWQKVFSTLDVDQKNSEIIRTTDRA
ncbi:MAG: NAD(P)H-binding protein [Bacteroidota bacterium]